MQIPTNPMYDIDLNGVVRLISTNAIIPEYVNHHGRRAVKIRGKSHKPSSRPLDRLMLSTYKPLPIDKDPEWMSVRFLDGNRDNVSVDNLEWDDTWYYPDPRLGIEFGVTGWIEAYGCPQFQIRLDNGNVWARCSRTYREIGPRLENGYMVFSVTWQKKPLIFHRLIALTFLPHPVDTDHLTVNHKDSQKDHNDPKNLEWATYTNNNAHSFAEGPRGETVRKIRLRNLQTGQETVVAGYNEMGRYFGKLPQLVHAVMERRRFEGRPYEGHVAKYEDDPRTWEELSRSGIRDSENYSGAIARKDLNTGDVFIYSSADELLKAERMNFWVLNRLLKSDQLVPWKRKCFQRTESGKELRWPVYPEAVLKAYDNIHSSDKPIEVVDNQDVSRFYTSVTDWCLEDRENRCDPAVLTRYLKRNGNKPLQWRDWVFSRIDLRRYEK